MATPGRQPGAGAARGQERLEDISHRHPDPNKRAIHGQRLKEIKEASCRGEEVCAWRWDGGGGGWAAEDGKRAWAESGGLLMPSQGWCLFGGRWEPRKALAEGEIMRPMLGVPLIHACAAAWIMCMPVPLRCDLDSRVRPPTPPHPRLRCPGPPTGWTAGLRTRPQAQALRKQFLEFWPLRCSGQ